MLARFKEIISKLIVPKARIDTGIEAAQGSLQAKRKQNMILWSGCAVALFIVCIWLKYKSSSAEGFKEVKEENEPLKLEVASKSLDAEKMWRNHFEDKLAEVSNQSKTKLELIENAIGEQSNAYTTQWKGEIDKLKAQLEYIAEEQSITKKELLDSRLQAQQEKEEQNNRSRSFDPEASNFVVNSLGRDGFFSKPKSTRSYIPATTHVTGIMLDGLSVSTAESSKEHPIPVTIRITGWGNLSRNFNVDITTCSILASAHGDLPSERAVLRAELLTCTDPVSQLVYETRVIGKVSGDDGMNGIKGKVVQTSTKHLKNAIIGGLISGLTGSAKSRGSFAITGAGAVSTKNQGFGEVLKDGVLEGAVNAGEKVVDYSIKQAESMSSVLIIPSGSRVDVSFTYGVYFGALDVQEKLDQARKKDEGKK